MGYEDGSFILGHPVERGGASTPEIHRGGEAGRNARKMRDSKTTERRELSRLVVDEMTAIWGSIFGAPEHVIFGVLCPFCGG